MYLDWSRWIHPKLFKIRWNVSHLEAATKISLQQASVSKTSGNRFAAVFSTFLFLVPVTAQAITMIYIYTPYNNQAYDPHQT